MQTKSKFKRLSAPLCFCVLLALLTACESGERYIGVYKAEVKMASELLEVGLELKENGAGVWRMGEEVSVSWVAKGNEIRLHLKDGGVVIGEFQDGAIHITLPNAGTMIFRKVK